MIRTLSLKCASRLGDVFERLLDAAAVLVEEPAVIVAAQPALLDETIREVGAAMRTMAVDQAESAAQIAVEHRSSPIKRTGLIGFASNSLTAGDRHPVAAQQVAHGRAHTHLR